MQSVTAAQGVQVVEPGAGEAIGWFGGTLVVKAAESSTGGAYSLLEVAEPPGSASPRHVHHGEDELLWVLEGSYEVHCGDTTATAPAGACVILPRDVPHSVRVLGPDPARALMLFTPAGFDGFFREVAREAAAAGGHPDPARMGAIAERHRVEIIGPPDPPPEP